MYEHKSAPLATRKVYHQRLQRNALYTAFILAICLAIGTAGFYITGNHVVKPVDAFHNASMLLSGMGPVLDSTKMSTGAKLFSSFYALFSGIAFISSISFLLAPAVHRFFHRLHLEK